MREHHAGKRDVNREQDLQDALAGSTAHWEGNIAANDLTPSAEVERQELYLRVMTAIQRLTQEQQDAVMAVRILQLSPQEAAQKLGKSEAAVASLYHRGIKRLRPLLDDVPRE